MTAYNIARVRSPGTYDITWGSLFLGSMDEVDPSAMEMVTKPIKVGSIGDVELGQWVIALKGPLKSVAREIDITQYQGLMPWYSTGSISLTPATWHKDLYSYAQQLTVHPIDVSGTAEDITLLMAFPMIKFPKRNGEDEKTDLEIDWLYWPLRTQLTTPGSPLLCYGYVGPAPSGSPY